MTIRYFRDTDTALIDFTENPVAQTKEISVGYPVDDAVEITGLSPDAVDAPTGKGR